MSDKEVLEKAISLAVEGGWRSEYEGLEVKNIGGSLVLKWWFDMGNEQIPQSEPIVTNNIIFNHDFAKALWGEGLRVGKDDGFFGEQVIDQPAWQYHLQMMVIDLNPIDYLRHNMADDGDAKS